jgi:hypothetical protein
MKKRSLAVLFVAAYVAACASEESTRADVVAGGRGTVDPRGAVSGTRPGNVSATEARANWEREIAGSTDGTGAGDRVFFTVDRSDLSPEAQETLRRQAEWLRRYSNLSVTIEGHADEHAPASTISASVTAVRQQPATSSLPPASRRSGSAPSLTARSVRPSSAPTRRPTPRTAAP